MAGYTRATQPASEPVTLDEVKAQAVVVAGSTDDALLTRLIKAARAEAESKTGLTLITSNWLRTLDGFSTAIRLLHGPIQSITSIKYDDENGVEQTLDPASYTLDTSDGMVGYVVPAYGCSWPTTRAHINAVRIAYAAGFGASASAVPEDLRHWIAVRVATLYEHRESVVVGAGLAVAQVPTLDAMLDLYRVPVV